MSYKPNWSNGEWLTICDACGRKFKDSALRMRWDGLMVCSGDWEVRQPQDYVRGVADIQAPPYVRPEQQDHFLPYNFTQYPNEEIEVNEQLAKQFTKPVGGRLITDSAINGAVLNLLAINATGNYYDPEQVTLSEEILFTLGRSLSDSISTPTEAITKALNKTFAETISISETLAIVEEELYVEDLALAESVQLRVAHGIIETLSLAESVSSSLFSPTALNGSALNSLGLD
jgi:hypothetical protein